MPFYIQNTFFYSANIKSTYFHFITSLFSTVDNDHHNLHPQRDQQQLWHKDKYKYCCAFKLKKFVFLWGGEWAVAGCDTITIVIIQIIFLQRPYENYFVLKNIYYFISVLQLNTM